MKLTSLAVLSAVLVVAGCGSPDAGSTPTADRSTSVAPTTNPDPTSTLSSVEPSVDTGATVGDQKAGIRHTSWLLVSGSVDEQQIPTEPDLVMRFDETILSFPLSCNSGAVPYQVNGDSIEFDLDYFSTTEKRCSTDPADPANMQANLFETGMRQAETVETVTIDPDEQQLEFKGNGVLMQFTRGTGD